MGSAWEMKSFVFKTGQGAQGAVSLVVDSRDNFREDTVGGCLAVRCVLWLSAKNGKSLWWIFRPREGDDLKKRLRNH